MTGKPSIPPTGLIAAIYARKSNKQKHPAGAVTSVTREVEQATESVTRQVEQATAYAAEHGWTVAEAHIYVDDKISGAEFERRPSLMRLLNALKPKPPFQVLLTYDRDRIGREQFETAYLLKKFDRAGVRVVETKTGGTEIRLDSSTAKVIMAVEAFAGEVEREKARQRTKDALLRKVQTGHVPGGTAYGYTNVRHAGGVVWIIDEVEAAGVRQVFQLAARGWGLKRIANHLNATSVPRPRSTRGPAPGWGKSAVRSILHRRVYAGQFVWNRSEKRDSWGQKAPHARPELEWIRVAKPELRIVSDADWQAAHTAMARTRATYLRGTRGHLGGRPINGIESRHVCTGLLQCGACGSSLTTHLRQMGPRTQRRSERVYVCTANIQKGRTGCANSLAMPSALVDAAVLAAVEHHVCRPDVLTAAVTEAIRRAQADDRPAQRARLQAARQAVEQKLARVAEAVQVADGPLATLVETLKTLEQERSALDLRLVEVDAALTVTRLDPARLAADLRTRLRDWTGLTRRHPAQARQILKKLLVGRLVMTPDPAARAYAFEGTGALDPILTGVIPLAALAPTRDGAPTSWNSAGNRTLPAARQTVTTPSSSG